MLSVIITTYNESDCLEACLQAVSWADEIIVVDSFSTDNTTDIASHYTERVFKRAYIGPADQKNWAMQFASNEWVLHLDADEVLTPALSSEIQQVLANPPKGISAFQIPRTNFFMDKRIRYSAWQGDAPIRLVRRHMRYGDTQVHETIQVQKSETAKLKADMLHYSFKSMEHFVEKQNRYAQWSALDHAAKTPKVTLYHLWLKPLARFAKHYFWGLGFLDGREGFIIAKFMAYGVFMRYVYMDDARRAGRAK